MIHDERYHREKRELFNVLILNNIEYRPHAHAIYLECYDPFVSWELVEEVYNKYYFDEVLFSIHLVVAAFMRRSSCTRSSRSKQENRGANDTQNSKYLEGFLKHRHSSQSKLYSHKSKELMKIFKKNLKAFLV